MESIDRAIRNAFAKAEAHNPATRQRIYEAAWGAHERALASNTSLNDAQKQQRRQKVKDTIARIESEFKVAPQRASTGAAARSADPVLDNPAESSVMLDQIDVRSDPGKGRRRPSEYDPGVSRRKSEKKRASLLYRLAIPLLIVLVVVVVGYSLVNSFTNFHRNSSTSSPLHANSTMSPLREGEDPDGRSWINIFTPQDATRMSVNGRAQAEIMGDGTSGFVRVTSGANSDTVSFEVGEGLLEQLVGKNATFDIVARSEAPTQLSVSCDFGGLGDCGRRRYDVNESVSDFLFDIAIPAGQKAGKAGSIIIHSDLAGEGKPVDIYAIRVTAVSE